MFRSNTDLKDPLLSWHDAGQHKSYDSRKGLHSILQELQLCVKNKMK